MPDTLNLRKTGHKHRADEIVYADKAAPHNKSGLSVTICLGCGEIITKDENYV